MWEVIMITTVNHRWRIETVKVNNGIDLCVFGLNKNWIETTAFYSKKKKKLTEEGWKKSEDKGLG